MEGFYEKCMSDPGVICFLMRLEWQVTCQVSSVLADCLNVKVAVKFAKIDPIATGRSEEGGNMEVSWRDIRGFCLRRVTVDLHDFMK